MQDCTSIHLGDGYIKIEMTIKSAETMSLVLVHCTGQAPKHHYISYISHNAANGIFSLDPA